MAGRPTAKPGSRIRFEGGDGSSVESAIRVVGAKGERDGVESEYWYLQQVYGSRESGTWQFVGQSLLHVSGKAYDHLDIVVGGRRTSVFFDISEFFGKLD